MNNENNVFGNITPIPPDGINENNNNIPNQQINNNTLSIPPMPAAKGEENKTNPQATLNPSIENPNIIIPASKEETANQNIKEATTNLNSNSVPNIIIPQQKEEANNNENLNIESPQTSNSTIPIMPIAETKNDILQTNKIPELKIDSANPFDIGLNNTTIPNQINNNQINSTTITPISVNQSTDNISSTASSNNIEPDIENPINNINLSNDNIVPVTTYLINIILFSIPIIGIIMLIMKATSKENKNISNFAKAYLIILIAVFILWIVFFVIFGATLFAFGNM